MRTSFEIEPKPSIIKQIDGECEKSFNCTKCKRAVVVSSENKTGSDKYLLVPKLKICLYPKGGIAFDVFCESCGTGLIGAFHAFMKNTTVTGSVVLKCESK